MSHQNKGCSETLQGSWTVHYNSIVNGTTKTWLHCARLIIDTVIATFSVNNTMYVLLKPFDFSGHQQWQRHQRWSTKKIGTNRSMPTFGPPFLAGPLLKHQAGSHQNHETPQESYPQGRRERKKQNKKQNKRRHQGNWENLWVPELSISQKTKPPWRLRAESVEETEKWSNVFFYIKYVKGVSEKSGRDSQQTVRLVLLTRSNIQY